MFVKFYAFAILCQLMDMHGLVKLFSWICKYDRTGTGLFLRWKWSQPSFRSCKQHVPKRKALGTKFFGWRPNGPEIVFCKNIGNSFSARNDRKHSSILKCKRITALERWHRIVNYWTEKELSDNVVHLKRLFHGHFYRKDSMMTIHLFSYSWAFIPSFFL